MICQKCGAEDTSVIDSRAADGGNSIRRRRECLKCGFRFTTYERVDSPNCIVVKKDGNREPFTREKLEKVFG